MLMDSLIHAYGICSSFLLMLIAVGLTIHRSDVRQERIAQALAAGSTTDQASNINDLKESRDSALRLVQVHQPLEPFIRHIDPCVVGLDLCVMGWIYECNANWDHIMKKRLPVSQMHD